MPLTTNLLPLSRKARIAKPHVRWYNSLTLTLPCKASGMPRERSNRMKILVFRSLHIDHTSYHLHKCYFFRQEQKCHLCR